MSAPRSIVIKMPVKRLLTGVAVAATLGSLASGAGASVTQSSLALMPLAKSMLGKEALSLPLDQDSGIVTNADAAKNANGKVSAAQLAGLGRITGYQLDYNDAAGHALAAGHGVLEVTTGVDLYRSAAAAADGLAFWRRDAKNLVRLRATGISASVKPFGPTGIPRPSYGWSGVVRVKGKPPVYGVQIGFVSGQLMAGISVSAADAGDRQGYAVSLARQLATRIRGVLSGQIKGSPVALPGKAKAGPPPNGPDLSLLTLSPADLGGGTVKQQGYRLDNDLSPVSEYARTMSPAGPFPVLQEQVALFHSATEAGYKFSVLASTLASSKALTLFGPSNGVTAYHPARVTVHGGDESLAIRATVDLTGGRSVSEALILLRTGATTEFVVVGAPATAPVPIGEIQGLTAAVAYRAAAGLKK
jgi:hypothetical protein